MRTRHLIAFLSFMLFVTALFAGDLRVNLTNGTDEHDGVADRVVLIDLTTGMTEVASADNVVKSVTFSDVATAGQTQYLVRATVQGATYSTTFVPTPGVTAWETSISVFESSETVTDLNVSVPFFVIYAFEDRIYIQKRLILENNSNPPVTFSKQPGLVKVHVPDNVSEMEYLTFKNGTMPLNTGPISTDDGQVLPNPIKPGTSEVDMAYYIPYDPAGTVVTEKVGYDIIHYHVYTMPMDLNISFPGLTREGSDNENGLAIYSLAEVKAGTMLELKVSGPGMSESDPQDHENHQQSSGRIVVENRLDQNTELLIAAVLVMAILIVLFISITQQQEDLKLESIEALKKQKTSLLKEYAGMDDSDKMKSKKESVLSQLVSVYKTLERIK